MERAAPRNAGCAAKSPTRSPSTKTRLPSLSERRYSAPMRIGSSPGSIYLARARQACHRRMLVAGFRGDRGNCPLWLPIPADTRARRKHQRLDHDRHRARGIKDGANVDVVEILELEPVNRDDWA